MILPAIRAKIVIAWALYAISVETGRKQIYTPYEHIPVDAKFYAESEFEVKKNFSAHAFSRKLDFKNLRRRISKILNSLSQN